MCVYVRIYICIYTWYCIYLCYITDTCSLFTGTNTQPGGGGLPEGIHCLTWGNGRCVKGITSRSTKSITSMQDMRGRHLNRSHQVSESNLATVKVHIKSFLARESHYSRKDTTRKYVAPELSVATMYDNCIFRNTKWMYTKESYLGRNRSQRSVEIYCHTYNTCFNLSFGTPRSDTCSACDELKIKMQAAESKEENK